MEIADFVHPTHVALTRAPLRMRAYAHKIATKLRKKIELCKFLEEKIAEMYRKMK